MKADSHLLEFIEAAKNQGASDEFLAGLLRAQGWKEETVYQALGARYEKLTGLQIPRRKRSGAAAKDAFLYLLAFSTLATWAIALGSLMFTLIEEWIADPVSPNQFSGQNFNNYSIASSIASMVVAFPIYFLVMWIIHREVKKDPEKLESSVRKWLSYIALLIAAGVVIGGLVTVVTYFLRGEITLRFITKAAVAIVISGGVFWYYLVSLKAPAQDAAAPSRANSIWAALTTAAVVAGVALGFINLGGPSVQRLVQADNKRISALEALASRVNVAWGTSGHTLPAAIQGGEMYTDPVTHQPYEYRPLEGTKYELCGNFARASQTAATGPPENFWRHPQGHHCFELDATQPAPYIATY
jgi:Domain of unknown function (DUF5671)